MESDNPTARETAFWWLHNSRENKSWLDDNRDAINRILDANGKDDTTASLVLACLAAGWSEDTRYVFELQQLRDHSSPKVRDAVAVASAMLLERSTLDRAQEIARPTIETKQPDSRMGVLMSARESLRQSQLMDVDSALTWHTHEAAKTALRRIAADDERIAAGELRDAEEMISVDDLP